MHNLLLRNFVADASLDPDRDIHIRVVPAPEMVGNLRSEMLVGIWLLFPSASVRSMIMSSLSLNRHLTFGSTIPAVCSVCRKSSLMRTRIRTPR